MLFFSVVCKSFFSLISEVSPQNNVYFSSQSGNPIKNLKAFLSLNLPAFFTLCSLAIGTAVYLLSPLPHEDARRLPFFMPPSHLVPHAVDE